MRRFPWPLCGLVVGRSGGWNCLSMCVQEGGEIWNLSHVCPFSVLFQYCIYYLVHMFVTFLQGLIWFIWMECRACTGDMIMHSWFLWRNQRARSDRVFFMALVCGSRTTTIDGVSSEHTVSLGKEIMARMGGGLSKKARSAAEHTQPPANKQE